LQQDPWPQAISKFKVGDVVDGEVQKVVPYGAFVRIGKVSTD
jgi:ribosomal protein S1